MAKFDKLAVMAKIGETGMVPVFYHKDAEVAKKVIKAMTVVFALSSLLIVVTLHRKYLQSVLSLLQRSALSLLSVSVVWLMLLQQPCIYSLVPILLLVRCSILTLLLSATAVV